MKNEEYFYCCKFDTISPLNNIKNIDKLKRKTNFNKKKYFLHIGFLLFFSLFQKKKNEALKSAKTHSYLRKTSTGHGVSKLLKMSHIILLRLFGSVLEEVIMSVPLSKNE